MYSRPCGNFFIKTKPCDSWRCHTAKARQTQLDADSERSINLYE